VAQDRVRHRRVEEEVRHADVDQVVVGGKPLATEPRRRHLARLRSLEILRLDGLEEGQALVNALLQLGKRLLGIRVRGRRLAAEIGRRIFRLIARRLDLARERVLIGRQASLSVP